MDELAKIWNLQLIGEGRQRRSYLSNNKRVVIKFPLYMSGLYSNQREHKAWRFFRNKVDAVPLAPSRLIDDTLLMMHFCPAIAGYTGSCEDSIEDKICRKLSIDQSLKDHNFNNLLLDLDSKQFGMLPNGKIVAYDYADNFIEENGVMFYDPY